MSATALETGLSLHCERAGHVYTTPTGDTVALEDVMLTVRAGEPLAVLGPSGSGQSTLLAVIAGLLAPSSGQVWVGGDEMTAMSERELLTLRAHRSRFSDAGDAGSEDKAYGRPLGMPTGAKA